MHMPDRAVTPETGDLVEVLGPYRELDRLDHRLVTAAARLFGYPAIAFGDLDRLVETVRSEVVRVPEAVRGLGVVLAKKVVRCVAVVAGRDGVVARFLPGVVLVIHYVAVSTARRIVAQVRVTLGVNKGVNADAGGKAYGYTYNDQL